MWYYVYVYLEYNIGLIVNDLFIYGEKYCDVNVIDFFLNWMLFGIIDVYKF